MVSQVEAKVRRARSRLTLNRYLHCLAWCGLVCIGLWALATLASRLSLLPLPIWPAGAIAAGLALLAAGIWALLARPTPLHAAVTLDAAAGLKERLSTALVLRASNDEFSRAARSDAERVAARLHVPAHIRLTPPPVWPWSVASTAAAVLLAWLLPTMSIWPQALAEDTGPELRALAEAEHRAIKADLDQQLRGVQELAEGNDKLKELAAQLEDLRMPDAPPRTPEDVRRDALRRIDDVRNKLDEQARGEDARKLEQVKRLLEELGRRQDPGQSSPLSEALARGDFQEAQKALEQLKAQLHEAAQQAESPEARQKLEEMRRQLDELAKKLQEMQSDLRMQKELEHKAGLTEEQARDLQQRSEGLSQEQIEELLKKELASKNLSPQQLEELARKLSQDQAARQMMKDLAQQLSRAAEAASECQNPGPSGEAAQQLSDALGQLGQQLSEMEAAEQMLNELRSQMNRLDNLREGVCRGPGRRDGDMDESQIGEQGPEYGLGRGRRIGEEKTAYKSDPTKAAVKLRDGEVIARMLVDGAAPRGEVEAEHVAAAQAEVRAAADAVEREKIPRQYQRVVQEYFERLAGLVRE